MKRGLLPVEHKSMLISLLDLETATVEDIMIPKSEIVGIDIEKPWSEILEQLKLQSIPDYLYTVIQ